jgi:uncharacterized membrane protein YgcG
MLRKRAEQFEDFLQRAEQGEKAEEPWAGLVQTAQEVARLAPVPPPPRRLSPGRQRLLTEAVRLREGKATQRRRVVPIMSKMKLASVVVAMLLFFAAVSGTGYALADDSLPGEPLYGLKGAFEQARVNLTRSPEAKAELAVGLAEQRMREIATMLEQGQTVDVEVVRQVRSSLMFAEASMQRLGDPEMEPIATQLRAQIQTRQGEFQARIGQLSQGEQTPVRELVQYMARTQTRLNASAGVGAQTQTRQGAPENVPAGSQQGAQDALGPNEGAPFYGEGHYGPGASGDLVPPEGPVQNAGDAPGRGYGPGQPPEDAPAWENESPAQPPIDPGAGSGPGTGQAGDGTQTGTGVNGQNQNGTGPGTGGVNSGGNDGGSSGGGNDGGSSGGTNGGSGGSSGGGGH